MVHIRTAKERGVDSDGHPNNPEWLEVIWDANDIDPTFFGAPEIEEWWAGGTVEEYEHARVLHRTDPSVSILSKTEYGDKILRQVAEKRGIVCN